MTSTEIHQVMKFEVTADKLPCRYDVFFVYRCASDTCNCHSAMTGSVTKVTANQRYCCATFDNSGTRTNLHTICSNRTDL